MCIQPYIFLFWIHLIFKLKFRLDNTDNKNENMTLYESSKILLGADKTKILEIVNVLYNFGTSTNYILLIMKNMMIAFSISESYTSKVLK